MRKPLKTVLITLGVIVAVPVVALATTTVANLVATRIEASQIAPYGEFVPVDGKKMNVVVSGQGDETVVLLPGLGTAAPGLDFQPLIRELEAHYRVVAVEPFGTGLSDQTEVPRTAENITREVHEALAYLGIDRYVLMGHSIAGIYALTYAADYRDELVAFVGIDSSVPDQPGSDQPIDTESLVTLRDLGIVRLAIALGGDAYAGLPYDDGTKREMTLLGLKNGTAATLLNEMQNARANFADVSGATFPRDLPVLLFVQSNDAELAGWVDLHGKQAASVDTGTVVLMQGDHYLHHTLSKQIASDSVSFLAGLPKP